ncbi:vitamin-D-receptor interacting mediator subunit 4-domain-containing protein [Aspergillus pseudoustus]|uniref:Mediator of RNA polymerase II transcription subunit 4 n=1 Tax=Aspergillus pseudoustus TaxID=1810923 RepID=A0ABR4L4Z5_9EURO
MNTTFQTALTTFESSLNALITSLTTSTTASGAPTAALNLLTADDTISTTIDTLKQHQANYARILALRAEAQSLEERVKDIVRLVVRYEKDVREVCGDDEDSEDEDDDEYDSGDLDGGNDVQVGANLDAVRSSTKRKEVDYKLLLDFARRISKYNHEAAADAEAGKTRAAKPAIAGPDHDTDMTGVGVVNGTSPDAEPVAAVTKDATSWLDESANMARQVYMLPYPMEDRIRLGVMGQIQLAAAEGRPGFDPEMEVERLIREAEGVGVAGAVLPAPAGEEPTRVNEAARAAVHAGSLAAGGHGVGAARAPKPRATLDLDLYDPDEDDD